MTRIIIDFVRRLLSSKRFRWSLAAAMALFVVVNGGLFVAYHGRTYPNTTVGGHQLGSVSDNQLQTDLKQLPLLPKEVTFEQDKTATKATIDNLGIGIDYQNLQSTVLSQRSWLPIANLIQKHDVSLSLKQDKSTLQSAISSALASFDRTPTDARITWQDTAFSIKAEAIGQKVDLSATKAQLLKSLSQGQSTVTVATKPVGATITKASLSDELQKLNQQAKTSITFLYNGQSKKLSGSEIAALYSEQVGILNISDSAIITVINNSGAAWGIVVDNQVAAAAAVKSALENQKDVAITLVAAPKVAKTIHYCTSVRGVSESLIPELDAKLKSTYADSRGWSLSGLVRFEKVDSGCELRVWLSSADQMPSFGAICDSIWSCTVSPSVIINYDRWTQTSPAWQASNGNLEDYRSMVINHETGHWFGFNHSYCGGAGQAAPVMQQQSIDLQGCTFNPWPTGGEQSRLKQVLGL